MNIFLPNSIQTQIELEEIADVKWQIIIPTTSRTTIGIVQDCLIGAYNLTGNNIKIDWRDAMNMISYTSQKNYNEIKKNKEYTGHELFSNIIPKKINTNIGIKIKNGKLESGQLSGDSIGSGKSNAIHQLIWDEYGATETLTFLNDVQKLINNYNLTTGFTVGIGDLYTAPELEKQVHQTYQTFDLKHSHLLTETENNPTFMNKELVEKQIFGDLTNIRDDIGKLLFSNLKPDNNFLIMANSGSKGNLTNYGQMAGCVGLQAVSGALPEKKVNSRTLPYFFQNDDRSESRGLIKSSFYNGVNFSEFVFLNMAGREGLIDTAIKTASSGYTERKLVKTLEDVVVKYDNTVRTANNTIIQFNYGDTGADTTKQYIYDIKLINYGDSEIEKKYKFTKEELKGFDFSEQDNDKYYKGILEMRDVLRDSQTKSRMQYITLASKFQLPINLLPIIEITRYDEKLKESKDKLTPEYVIKKLDEILLNENTKLMCINKDIKDSIKEQDEIIAKTSFKIALHDGLAPKRCIVEYGLNKTQFDIIIKKIVDSYNKNIVEPGEHVGVIAAQSMGEPTTQLTISSFHTAGIAGVQDTTQGVPRVVEILGLSKNIKTPRMIMYLSEENRASREMANKIASYIKYTTIGHLRKGINVYYDPLPYAKDGFMEKDNVYNVYYSHNQTKSSCQSDITTLPWLIRIELDREKMLDKEVTLLEIKSKFCNSWEKRYQDMKNMKKEEKYVLEKILQCAVLSNSDNDLEPVLHIRIDIAEFETILINDFIDHVIDKFKLKGIPSVTDISAITESRVLTYDNPNHDIIPDKQYVIYAKGINLYDIRYLNGIDIYKTIANDIIQMYETFGIEAARTTLITEIFKAYNKEGMVNYHHICLLADLMTNGGFLSSIDRHGMNKSEVEPLSRASFEKMVDQLITAAVFNEVDHMKGVSSRIMAGLVVKGGTGMCDLIVDNEMLERSEFVEDISQAYNKTYKDITSSNVIKDIVNKDEIGDIFMPM